MELFWQKVNSGGQVIRPASGIPVIAVVDIGENRRRVIRAAYAAPKSLEMHPDCDGGEYDEESDKYWCDEGWYEENEFEDIHYGVDGVVTHWMPLPPLPGDPVVDDAHNGMDCTGPGCLRCEEDGSTYC